MKTLVTLFLMILLISACSMTQQQMPIKIIKFKTSKDTIKIGEKTSLEWEVQNADSIVLRESGFDEQLLENAPMRSKMKVSPMVSAGYNLIAYNQNESKKDRCHLVVIDTIQRFKDKPIEIVRIVKPEPNNEQSKTVKGRQSIDRINKDSKFKYEIFFIDKLNYPYEIKLYVLVKDEKGNIITNLAPPYNTLEYSKKYFLNLKEEVENKEYKIDDFQVEERHDSLAQKYSFSLVLDHSGSMVSTIDSLQKAARLFLQMKSQKDNASLIKFDHFVDRAVDLTYNLNSLLNLNLYDGLNGFAGGTALYAAADEGIRSLSGTKSSKVEILFTDGNENASLFASLISNQGFSYKKSQLIYKARDENVRIFTIGYGNINKTDLEAISELTDAKSYYPKNCKEINEIFNELPWILHNYYLITYTPKLKNGEHNISISFGNPDGSTSSINRKTFIGKPNIPDSMQRQCIAYFEYKKDELQELFKPMIGSLANYMLKNSKSKLEIHGHTDLTGASNANVELSKKRAEAVEKEIIRFGIAKSRINIIPHGMNEPIWNPEDDEYKANQNRRVEFIIKD
ncbi:MAG: OmpA family protein [Candidatus Kapabacteria bacterium]|nr:OmpA family protein [Candidatus Kapabacteria bacterium]